MINCFVLAVIMSIDFQSANYQTYHTNKKQKQTIKKIIFITEIEIFNQIKVFHIFRFRNYMKSYYFFRSYSHRFLEKQFLRNWQFFSISAS